MLEKFLEDPSKLGVAAMLLIAVASLVRGWVVPAYVLQERDAQIQKLTVERDEFKRLAMQSIDVAERTQRVRGGGFVGRKEPT